MSALISSFLAAHTCRTLRNAPRFFRDIRRAAPPKWGAASTAALTAGKGVAVSGACRQP